MAENTREGERVGDERPQVPAPGALETTVPEIDVMPTSSGSQAALLSQNENQPASSEVVVTGGNFPNANFGPQTSTVHVQAKRYENSVVNEVHHHHYEEASTSAPVQPKRRRLETAEIEEGYIQISDDIFMYDKEPLIHGTNIYGGYQQHVAAPETSGIPNRLPVAVKQIVPSTDKHIKEVGYLVKLAAHPNVTRIIHSKEHKTPHVRILYIVMELCSRQNLQDYLDENRRNNSPFNFRKTMSFAKQLVEGMKHIHDNGIVHRDVKPENILLSENGSQLKYADFGLGKELRQGRTSTRVTAQGQGTVGFAAPETHSSETVSKRADIFSLGITMFELWSDGKHPFGENILLRDHNILTNSNLDFSGLLITGVLREEFLDLMGLMLQHEPHLRPTIDDVARHPFFRRGRGEVATIPEDVDTTGVSQLDEAEPSLAHESETVPKEPTSSSSGLPPNVEEEEVAVGGGRTYFTPEEQASHLLQERKYDEAISKLENLESTKRQQTILAECYFRVGRDAEASACMEKLKDIISSAEDRPKPDDAIKSVEAFIDNSLFIQALILLPSVAELCKKDATPNDALWGYVLCVWRGSNIVKSMYKQGGRMQEISKTVALQMLFHILEYLRNVTGADQDRKVDMESRCLNDIGTAYDEIESYEEAIGFYRRGLDLMMDHFGSNASKYSVLHRLLNNLGCTQYKRGNFKEAEKSLKKSIKASEVAEDQPTEEEKRTVTSQLHLTLERVQSRRRQSADA